MYFVFFGNQENCTLHFVVNVVLVFCGKQENCTLHLWKPRKSISKGEIVSWAGVITWQNEMSDFEIDFAQQSKQKFLATIVTPHLTHVSNQLSKWVLVLN